MGGRRIDFNGSGKVSTWERDGLWYARANYKDAAGVVKPYERTGRTERTAKSALKDQLTRWADEGGTANAPAGGMTARSKVGDAVEEHLRWLRGEVEEDRVSPGTVRTYTSIWRNHLEPNVRGWRLSDVTTQRLDNLFAKLRTECGLSTARTARAVLSAGLSIAVRYGAIPVNPMREARSIPKAKSKDALSLTREQAVELVEALRADRVARRQDLADLVLWMLTTSDRIGNALAAAWERVDISSGYADLGPIVVQVNGKGLVVREADVSTKSQSRRVVLPQVMLRRLRDRRIAQPPETAYVFPHPHQRRNSNPDGLRDPSNTSRQLRAAMERAGYGWVTPHVFRKTVATALRDGGVHTRLVSDYLGHSREEETTGTYMNKGGAQHPMIRTSLDAWLEPLAQVVPLDSRRETS